MRILASEIVGAFDARESRSLLSESLEQDASCARNAFQRFRSLPNDSHVFVRVEIRSLRCYALAFCRLTLCRGELDKRIILAYIIIRIIIELELECIHPMGNTNTSQCSA